MSDIQDCRFVSGLSLRDYFAARSIDAAVAILRIEYGENRENIWVARSAYALADAMLQARDEPRGSDE